MWQSTFLRLLTLGLFGCGPSFPPAWLIEPEPLDARGTIDPDGKLRVLALTVDPPQAPPLARVSVSSLVVTHPRFGQVVLQGGQPVHTLTPRGLSLLYRACVVPDSATVLQPCGLSADRSAPSTLAWDLPVRADGSTELVIPGSQPTPSTLLVTLIAADEAYPGGATACAQAAAQQDGLSPIPNHCVIAVKRILVSHDAIPNQNPQLGRLWLGSAPESLSDLESGEARYPKLPAELADADRPSWQVVIERAADSEQMEPDPLDRSRQRPELLSASVFVTSGTLESGRGSFWDLDCPSESCPQRLTTTFSWQPAAARAAIEAPEDRTYFAVILRDDRGGASFRVGEAKAR